MISFWNSIGFQLFLMIFSICSCTLAINQVDTHGQAEDVVDTTQSTDPEVSPTISLPIKPL